MQSTVGGVLTMTAGSLLAARGVSLVVCIEEDEMGKIRLCQCALECER